jgi:hypothetical protein
MIILDYVLIVLLAVMTHQDLKTKMIDDWLVALFWIISMLAHPDYSTIAVMFFGSLMMLNVFALKVDKKEVFGWADILVIPMLFCWIAAMTTLEFSGIVLMIAWFITFALSRIKKETVPFIGILGSMYILFLFYRLMFG